MLWATLLFWLRDGDGIALLLQCGERPIDGCIAVLSSELAEVFVVGRAAGAFLRSRVRGWATWLLDVLVPLPTADLRRWPCLLSRWVIRNRESGRHRKRPESAMSTVRRW